MFKRLLAALLLAMPLPAAAAPALWKLADADTTIWLFGTVHLLPKGETWLQGEVKTAFDKADTLALEVLLPKDPRAVAQAMFRRGLSSNLPPVDARVPPERRAALNTALRQTGIPDVVLPSMETWLVALTLTSAQLSQLELKAAEGVETKLLGAAKGKTLVGLETLDQQMELFDSLPESDQRALLAATVEDLPQAPNSLARLIAAWRSGDVERLGAEMNEHLRSTPGLAKALLTERNARWADWLKARLATPGHVFVAVGAGHLAGPDSVQSMLAKRGVTVKRVQ